MKKLSCLLFAALLVVSVASQSSARTTAFGGTMTIDLGSLPEVPIKGTGIATVGGLLTNTAATTIQHVTTLAIAASVFKGSSTVPVTDPDSVQIKAVAVTVTNSAGSLGGPVGRMMGDAITKDTLGLSGGLARICLLTPVCGPTNSIPLALTNSMGVGLGVGGQQTIGGGGTLRISIDHAPWTILTGTAIDQPDNTANGSVSFSGGTGGTQNYRIDAKNGFAHGPNSMTSSTGFTSGIMQFVTPGQVTTNITSTTSLRISNISEVRFHLVPEPGLVLLLGTGVAGLAVLGRRRLRK